MSDRPEARSARSRRLQPVARHGILSSPHPIVQLLQILGAIVLVVVLSAACVGAFTLWDATRAIDENGISIGDDDATLPPSVGEIEGGVNVLVAGTDSCEGQDITLFPRCADDDGGERNDVTMLVHISDQPRRVTVVSFPRDMIVPIPSCPDGKGGEYSAQSAQMLNASYMYGGLPCTVLTVEALTGIDIQFAAAIRWTGVINMSDAIGGVPVCVQEDISDRHTGLNLTAGTHQLKGAEALQFLRIRHGIGDGSDLGRISNQQQFMSSLVRKLQSNEVLANPVALGSLASTALQQVNGKQLILSNSLNATRMVQIAMAVRAVKYDDIVFVQYPTAYAQGGSRVVPITSAADQLFDALAANKPIQLSGTTSDGSATEVVGEASQGDPTPAATDAATPSATPDAEAPDAGAPDAGATDAGAATPGADAATPGATPGPDDAVVLPDTIPGQTAAQVTCTRAQH